jgi:hypothetical protein
MIILTGMVILEFFLVFFCSRDIRYVSLGYYYFLSDILIDG